MSNGNRLFDKPAKFLARLRTLDDDEIGGAIRNFTTLSSFLKEFDLVSIERALEMEKAGKNRPYILIRLVQRKHVVLRAIETLELFKKIQKKKARARARKRAA